MRGQIDWASRSPDGPKCLESKWEDCYNRFIHLQTDRHTDLYTYKLFNCLCPTDCLRGWVIADDPLPLNGDWRRLAARNAGNGGDTQKGVTGGRNFSKGMYTAIIPLAKHILTLWVIPRSAWALGSYCSSPPAGGTPHILSFKT